MSDHPHGSVVLFLDEAGEFRWHRFAANGNIVADSGEGYENHGDALEAATKEAAAFSIALVDETRPADA